ncbi:Tripeptide aminopeptidase [Clostridiaceae bacterium JG1575]|nr:Tripeptide aminopeptidase [Clostridiaceae bacterium JG1575]
MNRAVKNLLRYVEINTRSDETSSTCPSTPGQMVLARLLQQELTELGLTTQLNDEGYLFATLPSNLRSSRPTVAFLAHLDTADFNAASVRPSIVRYTGGDIPLGESQKVLSVKEFPNLVNYHGQHLVVTDGTTLLGADDKAGIAEIMAALAILHENPTIPHGEVKVAFTPDEEIGRGPDRFPVEALGADFGYTVDGGPLGELQYENFNAATAVVTVKGRSVHPGAAKDKLVNATLLAMEFQQQLPNEERPEHTEGYEGFYHLVAFQGSVDEAKMTYILRDFDLESFEERKKNLRRIAKKIHEANPISLIRVDIKDSYFNMKEKIEPRMEIIDYARRAYDMAGVPVEISPIRGGTDGAQLSFKGLPCPNLFTGGENFHGEYEFISVEAMATAVRVLLNLIQVIAHPEDN